MYPVLTKGLSESHYCAYDPKNLTVFCDGDSGGPLQIMDSNSETSEVVAIAAFQFYSCTPYRPAVYTRVAYYIKWIVDNVWPDGSIPVAQEFY